MDTTLSTFSDWKEWLRMRALSLKHEGWSQRTIAEALGVSSQPSASGLPLLNEVARMHFVRTQFLAATVD
jgi:hypothetical protein